MTKLSAACLTDVGRMRDHNEDSVGAYPGLGLWVVADGMGGHEAGEVASELAVSHIPRLVAEGSTLVEAVERCHRIIQKAPEIGTGVRGMGTTVVAAQLQANGAFQVCWVGDSRAYVFGRGRLRQLTIDHSYVQTLVNAGVITAQEAETHPERNVVTQSLGTETLAAVEVGRFSGRMEQGDVLLLCSDGLTGEVSDGDVAAVLGTETSLEEKARRLVGEANANGGSDNIAVALIPAGAGSPAAAAKSFPGTRPVPAVRPARRLATRRVLVGAAAVAAMVLLAVSGSLFLLREGEDVPPGMSDPDDVEVVVDPATPDTPIVDDSEPVPEFDPQNVDPVDSAGGGVPTGAPGQPGEPEDTAAQDDSWAESPVVEAEEQEPAAAGDLDEVPPHGVPSEPAAQETANAEEPGRYAAPNVTPPSEREPEAGTGAHEVENVPATPPHSTVNEVQDSLSSGGTAPLMYVVQVRGVAPPFAFGCLTERDFEPYEEAVGNLGPINRGVAEALADWLSDETGKDYWYPPGGADLQEAKELEEAKDRLTAEPDEDVLPCREPERSGRKFFLLREYPG